MVLMMIIMMTTTDFTYSLMSVDDITYFMTSAQINHS